MAALPYLQLYVADWLADTMHLTTLEQGAYFLLVCNYWQTGKSLPNDDKRLSSITKLSLDEWGEIKDTILEFFDKKSERLYHYRIEAELDKVEQKSKQAKDAGKKSAQARIAAKLKNEQNQNCGSTDVNTKEQTDVSTDVNTDEPTKLQRNVNHTDTNTDTNTNTDTDTDTDRGHSPVEKNEISKNRKKQKFLKADYAREILEKFGWLHEELKSIKPGKIVDDHVWFAGKVINENKDLPINGQPFSIALERSVKNLSKKQWFLGHGGLYWMLDIKSGKYNGEQARIRVAKYINLENCNEQESKEIDISEKIDKQVAEYMGENS